MGRHRRRIRDLVGICSALYVACLAFTAELARASCAGPVPLSTLQADADVILLGQVTQTTQHHARVVVRTYSKGRGPDELNVTGRYDPDMFTSVDFLFEPGQHYLLFLTGSPPGLLRTDSCTGNRGDATDLTSEELAVLGQGVPPDPAIADPTPLGATTEPAPTTREQPRAAPASNDERPPFNGQATALLAATGFLLVGVLVFIAMRRAQQVE